MPVIHASDSPTHELPGARFTSLVGPRLGARDTSVWHVELAAGGAPTLHEVTREEVFVILSGRAESASPASRAKLRRGMLCSCRRSLRSRSKARRTGRSAPCAVCRSEGKRGSRAVSRSRLPGRRDGAMVKERASGEAAIPLARLMAMAFRSLIDELHDRLQARGWKDVRASYGYVLVAARDAPLTVTAVAALLGMTKQAASKLVDAMVEGGYLCRSADSEDARRQRLELSSKGARLLAAVEAIYAELEGEWGEIIGGRAVERVRSDLTRVLRGLHGGRLPAIRPTS